MPTNHRDVEKQLWSAADELRANSQLRSAEYSTPVLGLIFLRYADHKFTQAEAEFSRERERQDQEAGATRRRRREIGPTDYQARGVLYLPDKARYSALLELPEGAEIGKAINEAMKAVEAENPELKEVLPRNYQKFESPLLFNLLRHINNVPMGIEGDAFGKIYEYFLGKFAMSEGQKGGEFFTPTSIVKFIVEVIEPFHGRIFDPACGSGGMFVQSARFVQNHKRNPNAEISVFGQERVAETRRLCRMNLAVHGLSGDIREANSYYEVAQGIKEFYGKFDFVMANPPFNVDKVDKPKLKDDKARFPFGMPTVDNANYLWIQLFYSAMGPKGRAGFVMASSAGDAGKSELEIRKQLIEAGAVDVVVAVGSNFFYTVTLPCTLWFLDKGKAQTERRDKVLFIDARHIFRQIDRAHREWKSGCLEKYELSQTMPALAEIEGLLVESPIDTDFWDWSEALETEEAVSQLIGPVVERMRKEAAPIIMRLYSAKTYSATAKRLLANGSASLGIMEDVAIALVRAAALSRGLNDENGGQVDLEDANVTKRISSSFSSLKRELSNLDTLAILNKKPDKEAADERAKALRDRKESFDAQAQAYLKDYLIRRGLLLNHRRTKLLLNENDLKGSVDAIYAEELAEALNLWRTTHGTNHIKNLRDIVKAYRSEPDAPRPYEDVAGLCKVATIADIETQGWSLNPGRYVGVGERAADDFEFEARLEELNEELVKLNAEARELEDQITENMTRLLEKEVTPTRSAHAS
jgi:type I restriction enzyme M protein